MAPFKNELKMPLTLEWFHVGDHHVWLYGAFWEQRNFNISNFSPPYIRVALVGPFDEWFQGDLDKSKCELYYEGYNSPINVVNAIYSFPSTWDDTFTENHNRPYYVFYKPIELDIRIPKAVSLLIPKHEKGINSTGHLRKWLMHIRGRYDKSFDLKSHLYPPRPEERGRYSEKSDNKTLMVCLKPFRSGPYTHLDALFDFMAYYDTMGVAHFIFYDAGASTPAVYALWRAASRAGLSVEILPWQLREWGGHEMHQTLLNELCLYRAMDLGYTNVLSVDVDEIIVPNKNNLQTLSMHSNWKIAWGDSEKPLINLIHTLDTAYPQAAALCFYNFFFRLEHADDTSLVNKSRFSFIRKVIRNKKESEGRFKCIFKPYRLRSVSIHWGVPISDEFQTINVPLFFGQMNHYRQGMKAEEHVIDRNISTSFRQILDSGRMAKAFVDISFKKTGG